MKYVSPLSEVELSTLIATYKFHPLAQVRSRAHSILLNLEGFRLQEIAKILYLTRQSVSTFFNETGRSPDITLKHMSQNQAKIMFIVVEKLTQTLQLEADFYFEIFAFECKKYGCFSVKNDRGKGNKSFFIGILRAIRVKECLVLVR